jgi:hypothetical protein
VGQDDIYRLSIDGSLDRIGAPVVRNTIQESRRLENVYVTPDPEHESILFGFPKVQKYMTELWRYNIRTGAWSYDRKTCSCISLASADESISWGDFSGTWENAVAKWGTWGQTDIGVRLYVGDTEGKVLLYSSVGAEDPEDVSIDTLIETGDIDFEHPDENKTFLRLSLRFDEVVDSDVTFQVYSSDDSGNSWVREGTLTVGSGEQAAILDFLITAPAIRFRLTSNSVVTPYVISELVLKVVLRGMEYEE